MFAYKMKGEFLGFFIPDYGKLLHIWGGLCRNFICFGVVFLPPNPLEEVLGRPFVSRMAVRMTLLCAPMDMKIGVGEGHFRWR